MNPETRELLAKLEQATSQGPLDPAELDDETVALRESWLSLGQLLEGADNERAHVSLPPRPCAKRRVAWPAWVLASAASLLVVLGASWYFVAASRDSASRDSASRDSASRDAVSSDAVSSDAVSNDAVSNSARDSLEPIDQGTAASSRVAGRAQNVLPVSERDSELAWDDALDDQLAQAHLALWHVHGVRTNREPGWRYLADEFQHMNDELANDAL